MGGIPIGRIAGFPVSVNWSVLVILWLFTWSLASTLPAAVPGYSKGAYWLAGACGALILLARLAAGTRTDTRGPRAPRRRQGVRRDAVAVRRRHTPRGRSEDS
jgi:hypothetical protein